LNTRRTNADVRFVIRHDASISDGHLASRDAFRNRHTILLLIRRNIDQVRAAQPMLRDLDRLLVTLKFG